MCAPPPSAKSRLSNDELTRRAPKIDNVRGTLDWCFSDVGDRALGVDLTAAYAPCVASLMADAGMPRTMRARPCAVSIPLPRPTRGCTYPKFNGALAPGLAELDQIDEALVAVEGASSRRRNPPWVPVGADRMPALQTAHSIVECEGFRPVFGDPEPEVRAARIVVDDRLSAWGARVASQNASVNGPFSGMVLYQHSIGNLNFKT